MIHEVTASSYHRIKALTPPPPSSLPPPSLLSPFSSLPLGTPYYLAPEVLSESHYSRKSDIWSVGGTTLQMLTGQPPWKSFDFQSPMALFFFIVQTTEPPPLPTKIHPALHTFLLRCFDRDSKQRPSAKELLQDPFLLMEEEEKEDGESDEEEEDNDHHHSTTLGRERTSVIVASPPGNYDETFAYLAREINKRSATPSDLMDTTTTTTTTTTIKMNGHALTPVGSSMRSGGGGGGGGGRLSPHNYRRETSPPASSSRSSELAVSPSDRYGSPRYTWSPRKVMRQDSELAFLLDSSGAAMTWGEMRSTTPSPRGGGRGGGPPPPPYQKDDEGEEETKSTSSSSHYHHHHYHHPLSNNPIDGTIVVTPTPNISPDMMQADDLLTKTTEESLTKLSGKTMVVVVVVVVVVVEVVVVVVVVVHF